MTSIRSVINYALDKIKKDWTVTFNAFQVDLTKALQSCEIIKTRVPFLYQENKFITFEVPNKDKDTDDKPEVEGEEQPPADEATKKSGKRIRTGLSITLSKIKFEVSDMAGYQKPKPRQFLQQLPARSKPAAPPKEESEEEQAPRRRRGGKNKNRSEEKPSKMTKM